MKGADQNHLANRALYIYIVDDEPMIGEMMDAVFCTQGFRTRVFSEPELALESLSQERIKPDVLLTDFLMGSMNGMDLIDACRALHPGLRTVLCSGHVNPEQLSRYPDPADAFVSKPCLPAALVGKVREALATKDGARMREVGG